MKLKLGILISGRGSNMVAIQNAIENKSLAASIELVISSNSKADGVKKAKAFGLNTISIEQNQFESKKDYEKEIVSNLLKKDVDLVVLAGYMKLVQTEILTAYKNRIINIHPSLLPSFKGLNAQKQAIEAGVRISGCTVHFVDETLDGGAIISQNAVLVNSEDTEETLCNKILIEEHKALPKAINSFGKNQIKIINNKTIVKGDKK
ncbi:phosphoribosylglycinamide formyltransferase [bacterium]|jgi:phosphoribosylglycinamide formyltransferase 1|nr:phosphoribosylglycinamide formyltransferase [bacterium]